MVTLCHLIICFCSQGFVGACRYQPQEDIRENTWENHPPVMEPMPLTFEKENVDKNKHLSLTQGHYII